MITRFMEASIYASKMARQPAAWVSAARTSARGLQHALTFFGVSALILLAVMLVRPDLARQMTQNWLDDDVADVESSDLQNLMPATLPTQPLAAQDKVTLNTQKQQQWVTSWLSRRYRVAGDATNMLVSTAYSTAHEIQLDPLLILAVMAIESGLNPFAESPVGAQGLMQVMSKLHHEKFQELGGVQAALNPAANIRVGSLILKDYVTRGGSVEAGLKTYVGAAAFENDAGYGARVLAEYRRLKQVSAGKQVPIISAPVVISASNMEKYTRAQLKQSKATQIAGL